MELSLEEALDILLEVIGCGIVLVLFGLWIHQSGIIVLLERMV